MRKAIKINTSSGKIKARPCKISKVVPEISFEIHIRAAISWKKSKELFFVESSDALALVDEHNIGFCIKKSKIADNHLKNVKKQLLNKTIEK